MNYFIHCKRQCYLHGIRLNLEDNSEIVQIGKALHEEKAEENKSTEIMLDNIKLDRLTNEYVTEIKKSDADMEACKWQVYYYLYVLKQKGVDRKGKIEYIEKNKQRKTEILELDDEHIQAVEKYVQEINHLIINNDVPERLDKRSCTKCAYYEYCYI